MPTQPLKRYRLAMGARPRSRQRTFVLQVVCPVLILGIAAMWLGESHADVSLVEPYFDPAIHDFPLSDNWFYGSVVHTGGKYLVIAAAALLLILAVIAAVKRKPRAQWGRLLYPVLCLGLTVMIAGVWKHRGHQGDPTDLVRFGGTRTSLEDQTPTIFGVHLGSPAAHATGGFAWLSLYFVAVSMRRARPWLWLMPGALLGLLFAWTQHVRGAHVPSHNLWSIAIAWGVAGVLAEVFRHFGLLAPGRDDPRPGQ